MQEKDTVWEQCWKREDPRVFPQYLAPYYQLQSPEIEIFQAHHLHTVCDAGCGYGAYTLAFASNGFEVYCFDLSPTAIEIAREALTAFGVEPAGMKATSVLDTGYPDERFDGTIAGSVLDHMTLEDAKKALEELLRITRNDGLILLSFDSPEAEDPGTYCPLPDGSIQFTEASPRNGMILRDYTPGEIDAFLKGQEILYRNTNPRGEQLVIFRKKN